MNKKFFSDQKGQTLVEAIIALTITVLIITSLVAGVIVSVKNARFAKNQSLATKYAQKGIEKVRIYRDQNDWDDFNEANCENKDLVGFTGLPSPFEPLIDCTLASVEPDRMQVQVIVSWTEGGRSHESRLTTYLTQWQ